MLGMLSTGYTIVAKADKALPLWTLSIIRYLIESLKSIGLEVGHGDAKMYSVTCLLDRPRSTFSKEKESHLP